LITVLDTNLTTKNMDQEMTNEQKKQLVTWAEQRDELLFAVSNLRTELEKLEHLNKEVAASKTTMEVEMNILTGRIEELKQKELDLIPLTTKENADLRNEKGMLQAEVAGLKLLIKNLISQKTQLMTDVDFALKTFESLRDEALKLDKIIGDVTAVSNSNAEKIDLLVANLAMSLEEIIEVNRKNVFETNVVIEKLPKMLMEAQKHGLIKNKT